MFTLSSEFITRHVRIALYALAGIIIQRGWASESFVEGGIGLLVGAVSWAWSLYGNRLVAKVNELVKNENFIVIAPAEIANQVPDAAAMAMESTTIVAPATVAKAVNATNSEANVKNEDNTTVTTNR